MILLVFKHEKNKERWYKLVQDCSADVFTASREFTN